MFTKSLKTLWDAIVHPTVRLNTDFPWGLWKGGKVYAVATVVFFVGSFLPVLPLFILGVLLPYLPTKLVLPLVQLMFRDDGTIAPGFFAALLLSSFLCGFVPEVMYLARSLRKDGKSLTSVLALNFKALAGSWWGSTVWAAAWRIVLAFGVNVALSLVVSSILGEPQQPTMDYVKMFCGSSLLAFAVLAVVFAPVFEEIVFRGFLFQMLRKGFRQGKGFSLVGNRPWAADLAAIVFSSAAFALLHMQFHPSTLILLFLFGCVQAELFRRTGSLPCAMLLHALNNGIQVLLLVLGQ